MCGERKWVCVSVEFCLHEAWMTASCIMYRNLVALRTHYSVARESVWSQCVSVRESAAGMHVAEKNERKLKVDSKYFPLSFIWNVELSEIGGEKKWKKYISFFIVWPTSGSCPRPRLFDGNKFHFVRAPTMQLNEFPDAEKYIHHRNEEEFSVGQNPEGGGARKKWNACGWQAKLQCAYYIHKVVRWFIGRQVFSFLFLWRRSHACDSFRRRVRTLLHFSVLSFI